MKRNILMMLVVSAAVVQLHAQSDTLRFEPQDEATDSVEYELIVFDPGYETFLLMQPFMEYHSQQYYENWNWRYATEWNYRHNSPLVYGDIYETYIDYRQNIDYGLELNYRLFYYFRFFEKENGVDLLPEKVF
ncbi:MAG: DUF6146 family protein [Bacteroidales bacterium]